MRELTAARARLVQLSKRYKTSSICCTCASITAAFKVKSRDDKFKHLKRLEMKQRQLDKFSKQASARAQKYWKIIGQYVPIIARNKSLEGIDRKARATAVEVSNSISEEFFGNSNKNGLGNYPRVYQRRFCYSAPAVTFTIGREWGGEESTNSALGMVTENAKRVDDLMNSSSSSPDNSSKKKPSEQKPAEEEITYVVAKDDVG